MNIDVRELTTQLVKIESTKDNPAGLRDSIDVVTQHLSRWTIEEFKKDGISSLLVYNQPKRPSKFKIILNGHLDVVPGKKEHYIPQLVGNKLYGVGVLDMKASVACLISVFTDVADVVDYPLALQLVTDEEIGGFKGTNYQIEQGVRADFVIAAEPTNLDIVNKARGILNLKIRFHGKTAHGAYPWRGINAIWKMNTYLNALAAKFPVPASESWVSTVNVAKVETNNSSFNKIPDDCTVWLDVRFVPEDSNTILKRITADLANDCDVSIEVNEPALSVSATNQFIMKLQTIAKVAKKSPVRLYGAQGSSDARHYTKIGIDGIEFGPVGGNIGADDEWVDTLSLNTYCEILKTYLLELS